MLECFETMRNSPHFLGMESNQIIPAGPTLNAILINASVRIVGTMNADFMNVGGLSIAYFFFSKRETYFVSPNILQTSPFWELI